MNRLAQSNRDRLPSWCFQRTISATNRPQRYFECILKPFHCTELKLISHGCCCFELLPGHGTLTKIFRTLIIIIIGYRPYNHFWVWTYTQPLKDSFTENNRLRFLLSFDTESWGLIMHTVLTSSRGLGLYNKLNSRTLTFLTSRPCKFKIHKIE